ncbi:MAG: DnaJ domain-containing protein [Gemmatimonadota bacterium]
MPARQVGERRCGVEGSQSRRHDRDPYEVLGVPADASAQEIARAYRRAAHLAHPDARPQDPQAAARFGALSDAYQTLSDPGRRADYDREHLRHHHPPQTTHAGAGSAARGSVARPPGAPPIWAGPVHVQPPGAPSAEPPQSAAPGRSAEPRPGNASAGRAHHRDPDVYLGLRPPGERNWPW